MKGALYSKKTLNYLRGILVDRRKRLARAVQTELSPAVEGERVNSGSNLLDAAIDCSTRDLAFQMAAVGSSEVQSIDRALRRLEEGSYGHCGDCGEPIAEARLRALPFAELCVKCQQAYEVRLKETGEGAPEAPEYGGFEEGGDAESGSFRVKGRKLS